MAAVHVVPARPVAPPVGPASAVAGVLAALLSLAWSWRPSPWTDEAATLSAAARPLPELWQMLGTVDAVHGLYYLGMHAWVAVAGTSPFALRLPSALATGAAAAALVLLVRRLGGTPRLALTGALVFAVLPRATWAGAEARPFALTALLAVLLTLAAVTAVRPGAASLWWVAYALVGGLAVAVNVYLALVVVAHAVTLALRPARGVLPRFLAAAAGAALLAAPVVIASAGQTGQLGPERAGPVGLLRAVVVNQVFLGDTPTPGTAPRASLSVRGVGDLWQPAALVLTLAALALAVLGVRAALRAGTADDAGARAEVVRWALPWAVLPPVLVVVVTLAGPPLYNPRYFTFTVPAVALLVALGLDALRGRAALAVAAAVLLVAAAPVYASQRGATAKNGSDWDEVAARVAAGRAAGDGVYFAPRSPDDMGRTSGDVRKTLREIEVAHPDAFAGLPDVTELSTPEQSGDLTGRSAPLLAAGGRVAQLRGLWVVRRADSPAAVTAAEDAFLAGAGLRPVAGWAGPSTQLVLLRR